MKKYTAYIYFQDLSWSLHKFDTTKECMYWISKMNERENYTMKNYEIKENKQ